MTDASNKAFEHIRLFAIKQQLPGISVAVALNDDNPFVQCMLFCIFGLLYTFQNFKNIIFRIKYTSTTNSLRSNGDVFSKL